MRGKWVRIIVVALLLALPFVVGFFYKRMTDVPREITIATGPDGGRYRVVATQLKEALEREHGITVHLRHTQGSMENLRLLSEGAVDFALYQPGTREKLGGDGISVDEIAFVANAYSEKLHIIVPHDSALTSAAQLKGKRIAVGSKQSGDYATSLMLLAHLALSENDIQPHYFEYREIDEGFRKGTIDAAFITIGNDAKILHTLLKSGRCKLLPVPYPDAMVTHNVSLSADHIPAGLYPTGNADGKDEPVTTVALSAQLLTRKDQKTRLVTVVTQTFLDERFLRRNGLLELFRDGHAFARRKPEFPIHDGAKAVYEPELRPLLNPDFVEATEGARSFVVSLLIAGYLLYRWWYKRRVRSHEHQLDRYIHAILEIERKQLGLDESPAAGNLDEDTVQLQHLLDEVTRVRQDALSQFTAHQLNEDRATDCFLEMCHALSDKINAKLTRLRLDKGFGELAAKFEAADK